MNQVTPSIRAVARRSPVPLHSKVPVPRLEHGQKLDAKEFLRRYEKMDEDEKAELIDGVVYMFPGFLGAQWHGVPDSLLQFWMTSYAFETQGVEHCLNSTIHLGGRNVPQPDGALRILPESGGKTYFDEKGMIVGPVELVAEISATTAAYDLGKKLDAYRDCGVQEYLVWSTKKETINWWRLEAGQYVALASDNEGIIRSRVFPGLWLDSKAILKRDGKRVIAVLKKGLKSAEHKKFLKRK